jgi:transposase
MRRKKAVAEQAAAVVAAGGEVWFGDETTLREFPPLRAAWAKRGQQQIVVISGRNARRVVHGALNVATGELLTVVRERSRQDDCLAFVDVLGQRRPHIPKLLVWDNAPPHHPKRVQAAAVAANIRLAFLPFRAPELMPCEDLWRLTKAVVAANRPYEAIQEQAERAVAWLAALSPFDRLLKAGLFGAKFQWLST